MAEPSATPDGGGWSLLLSANAATTQRVRKSFSQEALPPQFRRQSVQLRILVLQLACLLFGQAGLLTTRKRLAELGQQHGNLTVGFQASLFDELLGFAEGSQGIGCHGCEF